MHPEIIKHIHWLAALVAGAEYFDLGTLWYSKVLFAPNWCALFKIDTSYLNATKGVASIILVSFINILTACAGLVILMAHPHLSGFSRSFKLGALTGICFGITAIGNSYLFEKSPMGLHLINGGYTLVGNIIAAVIICVWQ